MNKKLIAPIVIGILLCLYYFGIVFALTLEGISSIIIGILTVVVILLIGVVIYVVKERIDEIKGGEEDDLSKY